jgi:hypothetical protein
MSKKPSHYDEPNRNAGEAGAADAAERAQHDTGQPPEKPSIDPKEVEQLLRAGTKLVHKGDDPKNWVTIVRVGDQLGIAFAATDEAVADLAKQDFVLAD